MSRYQVLVDISVWIEYFKSGSFSTLDRLIEEGFVCTNELILTELFPVLIHQQEKEIIDGLAAIDKLPLRIDWGIIRNYQLMNLKQGINKVGIPHLIILQQVIDQKITLFSLDKHFKLMQNHLSYNLMNE